MTKMFNLVTFEKRSQIGFFYLFWSQQKGSGYIFRSKERDCLMHKEAYIFGRVYIKMFNQAV